MIQVPFTGNTRQQFKFCSLSEELDPLAMTPDDFWTLRLAGGLGTQAARLSSLILLVYNSAPESVLTGKAGFPAQRLMTRPGPGPAVTSESPGPSPRSLPVRVTVIKCQFATKP